MTRLHWLGAALVFLGSTAAGLALRQELRLRLRLLTAVIDSLNLLRSDIVGRLLPLPEALRHLAAGAQIADVHIARRARCKAGAHLAVRDALLHVFKPLLIFHILCILRIDKP